MDRSTMAAVAVLAALGCADGSGGGSTGTAGVSTRRVEVTLHNATARAYDAVEWSADGSSWARYEAPWYPGETITVGRVREGEYTWRAYWYVLPDDWWDREPAGSPPKDLELGGIVPLGTHAVVGLGGVCYLSLRDGPIEPPPLPTLCPTYAVQYLPLNNARFQVLSWRLAGTTAWSEMTFEPWWYPGLRVYLGALTPGRYEFELNHAPRGTRDIGPAGTPFFVEFYPEHAE